MRKYKPMLVDNDGFNKTYYDLSEGTINPNFYLYDVEGRIDNVLKRIKNKNYKLTALCMILSSATSKYKIDFKGQDKVVTG